MKGLCNIDPAMNILNRPAITVIVPFYNHHASLGRALASLESELLPDDCVIVVDDASLKPCCVPEGVCLIRLEKNQGAAAARNKGFEAAKTPLVAFLDADDLCLKGRFSASWHALQQGADAVLGGFIIARHGLKEAQINPPIAGTDLFPLILQGQLFAAGSTLFAWRAAMISYDENLRHYEDWDLLLRLCQKGRVVSNGVICAKIEQDLHIGASSRRVAALEFLEQCWVPCFHKAERCSFCASLAYERASLAFAQKTWLRFGLTLGQALWFQPVLTMRRLWGRVVKKRV